MRLRSGDTERPISGRCPEGSPTGSVAVSVGIVLFPTPGSDAAAMPVAQRAISYSALFVFVFCPVFYLVSDRRPLKRRLPALARLTRGQELAAFVLCEVVGFIVIGFASSAFPAG